MAVVKRLIPVLVSAGLLYLVFKDIDLASMAASLVRVSPWAILASLGLMSLSLVCKAQRWRALLKALKPAVGFVNVFVSLCIGVFADHLLPAKAGEFVRAYLLGTKERMSRASVFGTVILERAQDVSLVLGISALAMVLFAVDNNLVRVLLKGGGTVLGVLALGVGFFVWQRGLLKRLVRTALPESLAAYAAALMDFLKEGLGAAGSKGRLARSVGWSLAMWSLVVASFCPVLYAFDYGAPVAPYAPFVLLLLISFGLAIPSVPGGIGIFEYAAYLCLQMSLPAEVFADPATQAKVAAFSLLFHLTQMLPELFFGALFFAREGLSVKLLEKMRRRQDKDA